jgi:predicted transcriptional regulator
MTMADVLELPDADRDLVSWIMREGPVSLAEARAAFPGEAEALPASLARLTESGFVARSEGEAEPRYSVRVTSRAARRVSSPDFWKALGE